MLGIDIQTWGDGEVKAVIDEVAHIIQQEKALSLLPLPPYGYAAQ